MLKQFREGSRWCPLNPGDPENDLFAVVEWTAKETLAWLQVKGFDAAWLMLWFLLSYLRYAAICSCEPYVLHKVLFIVEHNLDPLNVFWHAESLVTNFRTSLHDLTVCQCHFEINDSPHHRLFVVQVFDLKRRKFASRHFSQLFKIWNPLCANNTPRWVSTDHPLALFYRSDTRTLNSLGIVVDNLMRDSLFIQEFLKLSNFLLTSFSFLLQLFDLLIFNFKLLKLFRCLRFFMLLNKNF